MKNLKSMKGITLIALVITIIVLLILAGVSISAITGENGIVSKAKGATQKTEEAEKEEQEILGSLDDYIDENANGTDSSSGDATSGGSAISLASQITEANYGDYVNYGVDLGIASAENNTLSNGEVPKTDWRIFYKDSTNVYLIASDYLPVSKFPSGVFRYNNGKYNGYWSTSDGVLTTSGNVTGNTKFLFNKLSNVTKDNSNYQAVSTLLDTTKWKGFAKEGYVDNVETAVIGSPTVEMWMSSWNEKYNDTLSFDVNTTGYQVGLNAENLSTYINGTDMQEKEGFINTLYYPHGNTSGTGWNGCYGYWLASPSASGANFVIFVDRDGGVRFYDYLDGVYGVRPVVSLKSNISASKSGDIWQLEN